MRGFHRAVGVGPAAEHDRGLELLVAAGDGGDIDADRRRIEIQWHACVVGEDVAERSVEQCFEGLHQARDDRDVVIWGDCAKTTLRSRSEPSMIFAARCLTSGGSTNENSPPSRNSRKARDNSELS